ncbi:MAG TPA: DNA primase [Acidobacteriota bacterium]
MDHNFTEEVRNSASIVQVISEYVTLKKAGKDHSALCPFHSEKTPSFYVSESKKIFKCFGCGASGDVFKFVEMIEGMSFPEALKEVARKAGVAVPDRHISPQAAIQKERLHAIMERAARFYQRALENASEPVMEYLAERGLREQEIRKFRIGYAPRSGNVLLKHLKELKFNEPEMELCGLLKSTAPGSFHDKFRERIMIPICDISGRVIALGGRIFGEGLPKYLNSPETPIYHKSSNLFGLNLSKEQIRRKDFAILVEGYFDLIIPFIRGVENIVASLGTSLTQNQVKLIGRYTRNVIVNYDPDSAGMAAASRSIDMFLQEGFRVNIVRLDEGLDPDSFVRRRGVEAYSQALKNSLKYIDFLLESAVRQERAASSPRGKVNILNKLLPYVALLPNRVERAETVSMLAGRLNLESSLILSELKKIAVERRREAKIEIPLNQAVTKTERRLVKLLVESHEARNEILPLLLQSDIKGLATESILKLLLEFYHLNKDVSFLGLKDLLESQEDRQLFEEIVVTRTIDPEPSLGEAINCLNALKRIGLEQAREELLTRIAKAENPEELNRLLEEKKELGRQLLT